jgi:cytoskeletal protein CcmA (bactofilin family)
MRLICDLTPHVSDAVSLGTSSLMFSDLFVASGSVINFNNGDMLLTHSSNALTVSGGQLTVTGEVQATSLDINGNADISGASHTDGIVRSRKNIVSNATYNVMSLNSSRGTNDYGGLNKDYMKIDMFTSGSSTDGNASEHRKGNFSLKLANNIGSTAMAEVLTITHAGAATFAGTIGSGAITSTGKITGTELEGTSLDINGNADISGTLNVHQGVEIADVIDGDFTALRLMNQKTYGSGTGTNEKVRFVMGISESGISFAGREGFAIDLGISAESDSSDGIVLFKVRDGGTLGTYQTVNGSDKSVAFAGTVTGTTLTGTSLDINGAADISGALTGVDALTMSGVLDITGTTDSSNATGDTGILRCEGGASIAKKLYVGSTITGSADVIAFSDRKLKENIETLDGKKVLDMRGVSFTRKDTGLPSSGVIAQEIQKVAPELVHDTEGTLGVAYGNLVGYLIEAVKDQQKQIDELKAMCNGCSK